MKKYTVIAEKPERVLKVLQKALPSVQYSLLAKALREKDIIINKVRVKENIVVSSGSEICIFINESKEKLLFSTFYEDENIIIINKDKNIEVESKTGDSVEQQLKNNGINATAVHRLDRNTSGLCCVCQKQNKRTRTAFGV